MAESTCKICASTLRAEIESRDSAADPEQTIKWAKENGIRLNKTMLTRHRNGHKDEENAKPARMLSALHAASAINKPPAGKFNDLTLLDAVTERACEKLLAGDYDLKLEMAFKAIEIKYKISEVSSNEKLLLEILSEIRADELGKSIKSKTLLSESA